MSGSLPLLAQRTSDKILLDDHVPSAGIKPRTCSLETKALLNVLHGEDCPPEIVEKKLKSVIIWSEHVRLKKCSTQNENYNTNKEITGTETPLIFCKAEIKINPLDK